VRVLLVGAVCALLAMGLGVPGHASGQAVVPCGNALEGLTTYVPRAVHAGTPLAIAVDHDGSSPIANPAISFGGQTVSFTHRDGDRVRVLVPVPDHLGRHRLIVSWDQPEQGVSCSGRDEYVVNVMGRGTRIGKTLLPRMAGRWRLSFHLLRPRGYTVRVQWRMRPLCDAGACDFRVRSSTGRRYRYRLRSDGSMRASGHGGPRFGSCTVTRTFAGVVVSRRTVNDAYTDRWVNVFDVSRERDEGGPIEALAIDGIAYHTAVPTPAARAIGCTATRFRERISGRRL
jgi:hypothetical protein